MRAYRPIVVGVVLVVLALAGAACATENPPVAAPSGAGAGSDTSAPSGTEVDAGSDAEVVADFTSFRSTGEMTTEKALQVFALAFGPMPGVTPPDDPALAFPGGTQTGVVLDVIDRFDELTPEQRTAVRTYLEADRTDADVEQLDGGAVPPATEPPATAPRFAPQQAPVTRTRVRAMVDEAVAGIQARTGSSSHAEIEIAFPGVDTLEGDGTWALAEPYLRVVRDEPTDPLQTLNHSKCRISVGEAVMRAGEAAYASIAHEVFHCFQYKHFEGAYFEFRSRPRWVVEGGAAWVGEELAGGTSTELAQSWWRSYLNGAAGGYEMYANGGYIAIGFWEHLDTAGADPWHKVLDVINVGSYSGSFTGASDEAAFQFLTGDDVGILSDWASSTARQSWAPSGTWELVTTAQQPTSDHRTPRNASLNHGANAVVALPGGQAMARLAPSGDVQYVAVQLSAPGAISWVEGGPGLSASAGTGKHAFCLIDECVCPDGSLPFDGGFTRVGGDKALVVAAVGRSSAESSIAVDGLTEEEVCEPCEGSSGFAPSMAAPRFAPTQSGDGTCPDRCLVGKWTLDTADLAAQAGATLAPSTVTIEGSVVLDLDGTRSVVTYADTMTAVRPMDAGLVMTIRFAWAGTATGTYSAAMGNITATEESNDVHETITGDINGREMPTTGMNFGAGGSVFGGAATYECEGATLVTQSAGTPFHHTWHRINPEG